MGPVRWPGGSGPSAVLNCGDVTVKSHDPDPIRRCWKRALSVPMVMSAPARVQQQGQAGLRVRIRGQQTGPAGVPPVTASPKCSKE